jgi:hypothetical protein
MGHLCIIVNHTKKLMLCPIMKHREMVLNHYGDYLILMLTEQDRLLKDSWYNWSMDMIEIVCDNHMSYYEKCHKYKDITKDVEKLFADSIGVYA